MRLSIIVPVYNESATIAAVLERLLTIELPLPREIIAVNDGSKDGTGAKALELAKADPALVVLRLRRNFGQTAAFSAGFAAGSLAFAGSTAAAATESTAPCLIHSAIRSIDSFDSGSAPFGSVALTLPNFT